MRITYTFDAQLAAKLWPVVRRHSGGRPTITFCNSRKNADLAAQEVSRASAGALLGANARGAQYLSHVASTKIQDHKLAELLKRGVGFYHSGLSVADRHTLEKLFSEGALPLLCSTSGLAQGVNLPAHLVVILNTAHYKKSGYEEYTRTEILQMAGRAGRPQFDTSGVCVVMTRTQMKVSCFSLSLAHSPTPHQQQSRSS